MTVDRIPRAALAPKPDLAIPRALSAAEIFVEHLPDGLVHGIERLRSRAAYYRQEALRAQERARLIYCHTVARLIPELRGVPQYRVMPKAGGAERVVLETQIFPFAPLRVVQS